MTEHRATPPKHAAFHGESLLSRAVREGKKDVVCKKLPGNAPDSASREQALAASARQPHAYELTPSDGFPMAPEELRSLCESCRNAGLTHEQAQAHLDWLNARHKALHEHIDAVRRNWLKELREDCEFGKDRFEDTIRDAVRALDTFDPDGVIRELLEESRFGDHPAIIRACARIGRALLEDRAFARSSGRHEQLPLEERLYPNM